MKELRLVNNIITLVDDDLFDFLSKWKWRLSTSGYACRNVYFKRSEGKQKTKQCLMHRFIWQKIYGDCLEDKVVDHIDHNTLNNQLSNLRLISQQENCYNSLNKENKTGFKFVEYIPQTNSGSAREKPYRARITIQGKRTSLGYFLTPEEAHICAIQKLKELGLRHF